MLMMTQGFATYQWGLREVNYLLGSAILLIINDIDHNYALTFHKVTLTPDF
jgi:hypothetical protein